MDSRKRQRKVDRGGIWCLMSDDRVEGIYQRGVILSLLYPARLQAVEKKHFQAGLILSLQPIYDCDDFIYLYRKSGVIFPTLMDICLYFYP